MIFFCMNINIYVYNIVNQLLKKSFKGEMEYFKISPPWDSNEGYFSKYVISTSFLIFCMTNLDKIMKHFMYIVESLFGIKLWPDTWSGTVFPATDWAAFDCHILQQNQLLSKMRIWDISITVFLPAFRTIFSSFYNVT